MIVIKSEHEIELMRQAGKVCAEIFEGLNTIIKPGISTKDIDHYVESTCKKHNMIPAEKGYCGYPASACTSVNEEVVHGIPNAKRILRDGDIVSVDIVVENQGLMADACRTYGVGQISQEHQHLIDTAKEAFFAGLKECKAGNRLLQVSKSVQNKVEGEGFNVIRDYTGHGIGRDMHEDPPVFHYVPDSRYERVPNPRLQKGMALCVEPMICEGDWEVDVLLDDWTAVTCDGGWAAHYENTIIITDGEPEVITL
ncbi:MAG: type I methionyl aminopeptidase [Clostridia bacterium]|nr:type I methionyl aminopeptidase [Clostridia bacterium]